VSPLAKGLPRGWPPTLPYPTLPHRMLLFFVATEYNWRVRIPLVFCRRRIQLAGSNPTCILSSPNTTGGFESHLYFVVAEYNWRVRIPLPTHTHCTPPCAALPTESGDTQTHTQQKPSLPKSPGSPCALLLPPRPRSAEGCILVAGCPEGLDGDIGSVARRHPLVVGQPTRRR